MQLIILNETRIFFILLLRGLRLSRRNFRSPRGTLSIRPWSNTSAGRRVCFKSNRLGYEADGTEDPPSPLTERLPGESWMPSFAIPSRICNVIFSLRAAKAAEFGG